MSDHLGLSEPEFYDDLLSLVHVRNLQPDANLGIFLAM